MKPITLFISSAVLVSAVCLHSTADQPIFTLTTGVSKGADWVCYKYHPNLPQGVSFHALATSAGTVSITGDCIEDLTSSFVFASNSVTWTIDPNWSWTTCGRCWTEDYMYLAAEQPRLSANAPFFPEYRVPSSVVHTSEAGHTGEARYSWGDPMSTHVDEGLSRSGAFRFTFCRDDLDASGSIDGGDLGMLLAWWGASEVDGSLWFCSRMDFDNSGAIDGADLGILLAHWGDCAIPN
jgi:hypothetical protein